MRERKPSSETSSCHRVSAVIRERSRERWEQAGEKKTHELVLATGDVGDVHVVGGGGEIFQLLAGEDVDGDQVDLGVTVLAGLGGGHVDDLARAALDDDVTTLPQSRALHGVGGGGAGIGGLEGVLML